MNCNDILTFLLPPAIWTQLVHANLSRTGSLYDSTHNHIDLFQVIGELRVKRHGEGGFGKIWPDPHDCLLTRTRLNILVLV